MPQMRRQSGSSSRSGRWNCLSVKNFLINKTLFNKKLEKSRARSYYKKRSDRLQWPKNSNGLIKIF